MNKTLSWKFLLLVTLLVGIGSRVLVGSVIGDILMACTELFGILTVVIFIQAMLAKSKRTPSEPEEVKEIEQPQKGFVSFSKMDRKAWGKSAVTGILGGIVIMMFGMPLFSIIGSIVFYLGIACGFVWLYKVIRKPKASDTVKG